MGRSVDMEPQNYENDRGILETIKKLPLKLRRVVLLALVGTTITAQSRESVAATADEVNRLVTRPGVAGEVNNLNDLKIDPKTHFGNVEDYQPDVNVDRKDSIKIEQQDLTEKIPLGLEGINLSAEEMKFLIDGFGVPDFAQKHFSLPFAVQFDDQGKIYLTNPYDQDGKHQFEQMPDGNLKRSVLTFMGSTEIKNYATEWAGQYRGLNLWINVDGIDVKDATISLQGSQGLNSETVASIGVYDVKKGVESKIKTTSPEESILTYQYNEETKSAFESIGLPFEWGKFYIFSGINTATEFTIVRVLLENGQVYLTSPNDSTAPKPPKLEDERVFATPQPVAFKYAAAAEDTTGISLISADASNPNAVQVIGGAEIFRAIGDESPLITLPEGYVEVKDLGNGWYTVFDSEGIPVGVIHESQFKVDANAAAAAETESNAWEGYEIVDFRSAGSSGEVISEGIHNMELQNNVWVSAIVEDVFKGGVLENDADVWYLRTSMNGKELIIALGKDGWDVAVSIANSSEGKIQLPANENAITLKVEKTVEFLKDKQGMPIVISFNASLIEDINKFRPGGEIYCGAPCDEYLNIFDQTETADLFNFGSENPQLLHGGKLYIPYKQVQAVVPSS